MESKASPRAETKLNPSVLPSPISHSSSSSSTLSSNAPITTRSEPNNNNNNNPYPTTFVQADTTSFKQVVQMLTGSNETIHKRNPILPVKSPARNKTGFKLFERRNSMKNGLKISPLSSGLLGNNQSSNLYNFSPRKSEILSPSMLDFPSLVLSPVTPLMLTDPFYRGCSSSKTSTGSTELSIGLEERSIAEKGFYLHSSPRQSSDEEVPKLLPLFPVTSPKCSEGS